MKPLYLFLLILVFSCKTETPHTHDTPEQKVNLSKTHIDPRQGYSEAVVVEANGIKTIYISGQVGEGEDFEAQFRDAIAKLQKTLKNSGASFTDVVKYSTFVVDYQPEYLDTFRAVRKELLGDSDMPASTLVGVPTLGAPNWGVEIEAIAVVAK
ncbi:RidA family protein [Croceitalea marina]|uniref:RidA family protein n=1 Tax=Croceitalea marina TaxID=1775166 RepID=A0ABW5MX14_9FLAO